MKRKTNLFYNTTNDTRFVTFSNYTESLTGNFLATNAKVFPSAFICFYSPRLETENVNDFNKEKATLLNIFMARYENKIAFLRDAYNSKNIVPGDEFSLLKYLCESLYDFDSDISIKYIGDITEEDYNGTFTDTICIVDISEFKSGFIEIGTTPGAKENRVKYEDDENYLYGWYENKSNEQGVSTPIYVGPEAYKNLKPMFDEVESTGKYYDIDSDYSDITITEGKTNEYVKFNVIIPLYDVFLTDDKNIDKDITLTVGESLIGSYTRNVPMGIWFSGLYPIELRRNGATNYAPSWSLVIGSQFKPFPYSGKMPSEITRTGKEDAFLTFAQVLTRQNKILDKFEELSEQISALNTKIQTVESSIANIGTQSNIDSLRADTETLKKDVETIKKHLNI